MRRNEPSLRLAEADRLALDRDGYVVMTSALDPAWVEALLLAFQGAEERTGTQHVEIGPSTPHREAWEALTEHPLILDAARHVLGRPFARPEVHGRNPLPGYGQQGLHTDWMVRSSSEPFVVLTAILMLDAFTADNGATRVVPGSHRIIAPIAKSYAQPLAHHPREVIVTGPSGSALIMNGHLWHSGTRNVSRGPRRAVQMVIRAQ